MKLIFFILCFFTSLAFGQSEIKFIVNASNPVSSITQEQIQDFYLKRVRFWPDKIPLRFFDRKEGTSERKVFISKYIKKTPRKIDQYWIGQKLFSGDSAPTQLPSDSLTVALVSRFSGGIGYVSGEFKGATGVKVIEVKEVKDE